MALARPWELVVTWTLRAAAVATAILHVIGGDVIYGIYCAAAVAMALVPAYLARSFRAVWPVEIEIAYLWFLISDMTLGNLAGLYLELPWYDKALHLGNAILVGMVAFHAVYLAHFLGRVRRHPWIDGAAILLVTLGLGATWEIGEYAVDHALGRATQGSPVQAPLDDTMWDLILDGVGGVIGAVLGPLYMFRSPRSRSRVEAVGRLIEERSRPRRERGRRWHGAGTNRGDDKEVTDEGREADEEAGVLVPVRR
jgi:hypothetical protein